jgi:murein peptide amidase A
MVKGSIVLCAFLFCGCASAPSDRPAIPSRYPPVNPTSAAPPTIIGRSVQGRPFELYTFGAGAIPVLVMGAIHGNEPTSANISQGLLEELQRHPQFPPLGGPAQQGGPTGAMNVPIAIIPVANPDGFAAGTRVNAHKVDLNRNFPATNWSARRRTKNNFGGQSSASEPETNALIQTIERLQPRLIISVHSMDHPTNNYDGPAQKIAELMSRYNGYPPTPTIGYPTPGSLGSWAGIDRQIPMITLELPRALPASQAWSNNRQAVLAAITAVR